MKINKKIFLGLGTIATVAAPVLVAVSCSKDNETKNTFVRATDGTYINVANIKKVVFGEKKTAAVYLEANTSSFSVDGESEFNKLLSAMGKTYDGLMSDWADKINSYFALFPSVVKITASPAPALSKLLDTASSSIDNLIPGTSWFTNIYPAARTVPPVIKFIAITSVKNVSKNTAEVTISCQNVDAVVSKTFTVTGFAPTTTP